MERHIAEAIDPLILRGPDDQLPDTGENGGLGTASTGADRLVEIISHCCRYNSRTLWGIAFFLLIVAILLWRR
jgi:hypothetical protein